MLRPSVGLRASSRAWALRERVSVPWRARALRERALKGPVPSRARVVRGRGWGAWWARALRGRALRGPVLWRARALRGLGRLGLSLRALRGLPRGRARVWGPWAWGRRRS